MQISLDGQARTERSVLALGMFDGVHLGHQVLLKKAKALAKQQKAPLVVCTFTTHPMALVHPEKAPPMLTTMDERARILEGLGVDILCAQPFDRLTMEMPPEEYIARLCQRFHPSFVVVGYNHTFGRNGEGNPLLISVLGQEVFHFAAQVVPKITLNGEEVSSTVIRGLLSRGDVDTARKMLGRPYARQAAVAGQGDKGVAFVMAPNGKQDVPSGIYRVTAGEGQGIFPATLRVQREGRALGRLPEPVSLGEEVTFRFFHRLEEARVRQPEK